MAAPDERAFTTFQRGQARDIILERFRNMLRSLNNPDTGEPFTEDEIQRATQPGSRFYIEADSIDLLSMSQQSRAQYLSDQIDVRRANTEVLDLEHGKNWLGEDSRLPATGASGPVTVTGQVGTVYPGSTTLGDPAASVATDPNGIRYQVLVTTVMPAGKTVEMPFQAVLTDANADGEVTNLAVGTKLTWSANIPPGSDPTATVADQGNGIGFTGGFNQETNQEYAQRIEERIRKRPASGNWAHFEAWAEQASVAVEQAFIYPCALSAGSVVVSALQKRNQSADPPQGPTGRQPSLGLLLQLNSFLVPTDSPVVPGRAFVLVVAPQFYLTNQIERVSMNQGVAGGWGDVQPWPNPPDAGASTEQVRIDTLTDQLNFTIETTSLLPGQTAATPLTLSGADAPQIMAWNRDQSRFEQLLVSSIQHNGVTTATVVLTSPPSFTLVNDVAPGGGTRISPYTDQLETMALSLEQYFDTLGAGEFFDSTDPRYARAVRQPRTQDEYPSRAGQALVAVMLENLGASASEVQLIYMERTVPELPAAVSDGPEILALGHVNLYPLE